MGILEESILLRREFNDRMISAMMSKMLNNPFLQTLSMQIFYVCFVIALFSLFSKIHTKNFVTDFTKWIIKVWIVLAVVNPGALRPVFPISGTKNLAIYTYDAFQGIFNGYAKGMGKEEDLAKNIDKLLTFQYNVTEAQNGCSANDAACWNNYLSGAVMEDNDKKLDDAAKAAGGMEYIAYTLTKVYVGFQKSISNPAYFVFPILMSIMGIIQAFVTMFMLLGLGLITAFSLMMVTVVTPFALLDKFTGQVIGAYKNVLACSLFLFTSKLILWISIVVMGAIHDATQNVFIKTVVSSAGTASSKEYGIGSPISLLIMSNFAAVFVVLFMQIIAVTKIPKISRDIMNLSLDSIVSIGDALLGAAMGMATMVGAAGGGLVGGAAGAAIGKGAEAIKGQGSSGGSGGGSGGGDVAVVGLTKDGLNNAAAEAVGSTNSAALASSKADVLKRKKDEASGKEKDKKEDKDEDGEEKKLFSRDNLGNAFESLGNMGISAAGTAANMFWDGVQGGMGQGDGLGTVKGGIKAAGNTKNIAAAGAAAFKGTSVLRDSAKKMIAGKKAQTSKANSKLNAAMNTEKSKLTDESKNQLISAADQIATGNATEKDYADFHNMKNKYDTASISGQLKDASLNDDYKNYEKKIKQENSKFLDDVSSSYDSKGEIDSLMAKKLTRKIASGEMTAAEVKKKTRLNKDSQNQVKRQEAEIAQAAENGSDMVPLIGKNGKYQTNKDGSTLMVSTKEARDHVAGVKSNKANQDKGLADLIVDQNKKALDKDIDKAYQKFQDGTLSAEERKELLESTTYGKELLIGDKDKLDKFEKMYGGSIDVSHLRKTDDQVGGQFQHFVENAGSRKSQYSSLDAKDNVQIAFDDVKNKKGQVTNKAASGIMINNENLVITNKADFDKIKDPANRKIVADHINMLDRVDKNPELKEKMTQDIYEKYKGQSGGEIAAVMEINDLERQLGLLKTFGLKK